MSALNHSRIVLSALFTVALAAAPAFAQQPNQEKADALLMRAIAAEELASQSETANARFDAARLHAKSASLRAENDLQGIASLRTAAMYYSYIDVARAADLMSTAADRAMAIGDVLTAANSYLDAAAILVHNSSNNRMTPSDFARVQIWIGQASAVADFPQLPLAEAERLRQRVGPDEGHFAG